MHPQFDYLLFQQGLDNSIVFLFHASLNKYSGPLIARRVPESVDFIGEILSLHHYSRFGSVFMFT